MRGSASPRFKSSMTMGPCKKGGAAVVKPSVEEEGGRERPEGRQRDAYNQLGLVNFVQLAVEKLPEMLLDGRGFRHLGEEASSKHIEPLCLLEELQFFADCKESTILQGRGAACPRFRGE